MSKKNKHTNKIWEIIGIIYIYLEIIKNHKLPITLLLKLKAEIHTQESRM